MKQAINSLKKYKRAEALAETIIDNNEEALKQTSRVPLECKVYYSFIKESDFPKQFKSPTKPSQMKKCHTDIYKIFARKGLSKSRIAPL